MHVGTYYAANFILRISIFYLGFYMLRFIEQNMLFRDAIVICLSIVNRNKLNSFTCTLPYFTYLYIVDLS